MTRKRKAFGYVTYKITNFKMDKPPHDDDIRYFGKDSGTQQVVVPYIGSADTGDSISLTDAAYVKSGMRGEMRGGTLVAHVYLRGATAYGGRLALAYDKNLMELADTTSVYDAVSGVGDVAISPEGHAASVLLGDGHALFAWYVDSGDPIEAKSNEVEIATIAFLLKDGVSEADFSRNTLGMYYVNETMVYGWTCSAEIVGVRDDLLVAYRNTAVKDEYLCDVAFEYPNSDVIPIEKYDVNVHVKNNDGKSLVSVVKLDTVDAETDIYGDTTIPMLAGTYFYRVTSPGYEVKTAERRRERDRQL